jgi:hypothetical protein
VRASSSVTGVNTAMGAVGNEGDLGRGEANRWQF